MNVPFFKYMTNLKDSKKVVAGCYIAIMVLCGVVGTLVGAIVVMDTRMRSKDSQLIACEKDKVKREIEIADQRKREADQKIAEKDAENKKLEDLVNAKAEKYEREKDSIIKVLQQQTINTNRKILTINKIIKQ